MAKYKAYPEYKDSGVEWLGEIPSHWKTISISRLFSRTKRTGYTEKELLSVYRDYGVIPKSSRDDNNNKPSEDLSPYQLVEPNDLVMNKMKAWQGSIAISEYEGIVSPAYFVYKPNNVLFELAHPRYVHYLLRNPIYVTQYLSRSKGIRVNQWDLDPDEFRNIELLLPDKTEQEKIYSFLDHETAKIDNLIEKQHQIIELLKEKRQAVISHAVTKGLNPDVPMKDSGVEWLGKVPTHWNVIRLKYLIKTFEQGWSPQCEARLAEKDEYGVLKVGCVNSGDFDPFEHKALPSNLEPQKQYLIKKNDLLISRANTKELVGSSAVVEKDYNNLILCDKLYRLKFGKPVNPHFISEFIRTPMVRKQIELSASGASHSMQNIGQDTIKELFVALPPESETQQLIAFIKNKINVFNSLIDLSQKQVSLLQERRTALISAAVTGKIDVRDWVAPDTQDVEEPQEATA